MFNPTILMDAQSVATRKIRRGLWLLPEETVDKVVAWWNENPFPFMLAHTVFEEWQATQG